MGFFYSVSVVGFLAAGQGVGDDFALGDLHSSRAARSAMKRVHLHLHISISICSVLCQKSLVILKRFGLSTFLCWHMINTYD